MMSQQVRPSPLPGRSAPPPSNALVIIDAVATETSGRWGIRIIRRDGSQLTQIANFSASKSKADNLVQASLRSFGAAIRASEQCGPIDLDIRCDAIRTQSFGIISRITGVNPVVRPNDPDAKALREMLTGEVAVEPVRVIPEPRARLKEAPKQGTVRPKFLSAIVSADASLDRKGTMAGLGWAVSNKAGDRIVGCGHGTKTVPTGSNNLAEVAAISFALNEACTQFPAITGGIIRVQSDSRNAIKIAERAVSGDPLPTSSKAQQQAIDELVGLVRGYGLHLKFEWVRGHNGDQLNEAADRMALIARRNFEFGVSEDVAQQITDSACSEIIAGGCESSVIVRTHEGQQPAEAA